MRRRFRIEGIPGIAARWYAVVARLGAPLRDLYRDVGGEVCSALPSGRVLDVGTGPGYLPLEIAHRCAGLEIIGVDVSGAMVEIARRNAARAGLSDRVHFQLANAADLPFADESFDLVVSTLSLHHWADPGACFREIYRVLSADGAALIYDIRRDTSREANAVFRRRYGWPAAAVMVVIVRAHSSISRARIEEILSSQQIGFASCSIEQRGLFLRLRLLKQCEREERLGDV